MATVFVATYGYEYEGDILVGVGFTFEDAAALLAGTDGDFSDIREYEPGVPDPVSEFARYTEGWRRKVITDPTTVQGCKWVPVGSEDI
jgi:hypothetical protein